MNGSAGGHEKPDEINNVSSCGPALISSRKRSSAEPDESKSLSDHSGLKRMSSLPIYPPSQLVLSLGNYKVLEAAGAELSMKASESASMPEMGEMKALGLSSVNNAGGPDLQQYAARSLNSGGGHHHHHHHRHNQEQEQELIARLLASHASASSTERSILQASLDGPRHTVQTHHGLSGGPPFEQGSNPGFLTRVAAPSKYLRHPPLHDNNFINTTLIKHYSRDALIKPYPYYNINIIENDINYTREEVPLEEEEEGLLRKNMDMRTQVMVVMEGRSIERTLCLHDYDSYESFAKALFEMFNSGTAHDIHSIASPPHTPTLYNAIPGYKIAYQDYEGDLLLAGDLPWREFIRAAKQIKILRIVKSKNIKATHCLDEP